MDVQSQLGFALAKTYGDLRLAHCCSGDAGTPAEEVVRQMFSEPEPGACLKMLLRWQGVYQWEALEAALEKVRVLRWHPDEEVKDMQTGIAWHLSVSSYDSI